MARGDEEALDTGHELEGYEIAERRRWEKKYNTNSCIHLSEHNVIQLHAASF